MAANHTDPPVLPKAPVYTLCPYCLHAESYPPSVLVLHSGYGTIYYPPDRNLTETMLLVAGFIAAIKLARLPESEATANGAKVLMAVSESARLAEAIVGKLADKMR